LADIGVLHNSVAEVIDDRSYGKDVAQGFSLSHHETFAVLIYWCVAVKPKTAAVYQSRAE
jgi:hypothetical protein